MIHVRTVYSKSCWFTVKNFYHFDDIHYIRNAISVDIGRMRDKRSYVDGCIVVPLGQR